MNVGSEPSTVNGGYIIRSLSRGLRVLKAFDRHPNGLSVADAVEITGLPSATVFRLLKTLCSEEFAEEYPPGTFHLSLESIKLGRSAHGSNSLVRASERELRKLSSETGETVNLGVLSGSQVLYLERISNQSFVGARVNIGSTLPVECTSMGKLLVALLDDDAQRDSLIGSLNFSTGRGPNAIGNAEELRKQLAQIRARGWAMQIDELDFGLSSVAAPIYGPSGQALAAVNVAVGSQHYSAEQMMTQLLPPLQRCCRDIEARMR
jgi:IclR family pca regulon transcriptional regulator